MKTYLTLLLPLLLVLFLFLLLVLHLLLPLILTLALTQTLIRRGRHCRVNPAGSDEWACELMTRSEA